ncbi:MAG: LysR family transcriptional regulator [Planctomycetota bacterium]|nr:MAG: LysR family transcriptional regulator [Planctomycetota bacterium]REK19932.1 MAG: LysR family transcriptional regulator [Planctomycetota bacterium]REK27497.1 MAG: LysR family transcriptional regulator [Planctomycetota bacterium]
MHLRNVEIFCDTVSHRSFSKAAEQRGISQPTVSQAIHQLEEQLGVALFDRSQRPLELTQAGHVFHDGCRKLLEGYRELADRLQHLSGVVAGRVRVASIYSVGLLQMAVYTQEFERRYPDVDLRLNYLHPDEVYSQIRRDEADLGIVSFPRDGGDIGCIPWIAQEMAVIVAADHPLADCESVALDSLNGTDFVSFTTDLTIRRETDRLLKSHRVTVHHVHEFDNVETIKRAVEIGAGVAILPLPTVRREIEQGLLKSVPFADVQFERPLGVIHKRHKHLSAAAERFVKLLHEELPDPSESAKPALTV